MAWAYNTADGIPNKGPSLAAGALVCTALAVFVVALRLYVRMGMIKSPGLDDLFIVVSLFGACGYTIATIIQTKHGLGIESLGDMPKENVASFGLVQYIGAPFYVIGIWGFKMSLLFSYLRFFSESVYRIVALCLLGVLTAAHIAFFFVFLLGCRPAHKNWDMSVPGTCIQLVPFYLTFSSLTIVFDLLVMLLPFPVILKLQFETRKKVVLLGLFALGVFVTVIQIIRIQTITSLSNYLDSAKSIIFSIVENDVGIIIASVPTLAPMFRYFSEKSRSGSHGTGSYRNASYGLNTFGSSGTRGRGGSIQPLGSATTTTDVEAHTESRGNSHSGSASSTEDILGTDSITKTTEIRVTRHASERQKASRPGSRVFPAPREEQKR